ncbi:hypothetical protein [Chitinophaga rhizosphaerae]|uniref:hypothetical protein n=1 Tax=Chitinophaga rhizosphaerae TaxID=1864947 RepID=UPI000F811341|nr:hypothetical protein [Chitinophaga rhizosphaerae]
MPQLKEDITACSEWIVQCFGSIQLLLDYSLDSIVHIDGFLQKNIVDAQPVPDSVLASNFGQILFGLGAYLGETIIRHVPGAVWVLENADPRGEINAVVRFPDGAQIWPMMKIIKRAQNGFEASVYPYAYELTKSYTNGTFNAAFWQISPREAPGKRPWYKFW